MQVLCCMDQKTGCYFILRTGEYYNLFIDCNHCKFSTIKKMEGHSSITGELIIINKVLIMIRKNLCYQSHLFSKTQYRAISSILMYSTKCEKTATSSACMAY